MKDNRIYVWLNMLIVQCIVTWVIIKVKNNVPLKTMHIIIIIKFTDIKYIKIVFNYEQKLIVDT